MAAAAGQAKLAQKDVDARWTKKNDESFYGYKNHVGVDKAHKLIRKWDVTDGVVHDSQKLDDILDPSNTAKDVWADSAYRSAAIERRLREKGLRSRIHRRAVRGHALSETQKAANTTRSKARASRAVCREFIGSERGSGCRDKDGVGNGGGRGHRRGGWEERHRKPVCG